MTITLLRAGGFAALALVSVAVLAPSSARAEGHGPWRYERGYYREWERPRAGWIAAAPVYVRPAPVYVAPPAPVYVAPPVVYSPPSVSFVFPLSFR